MGGFLGVLAGMGDRAHEHNLLELQQRIQQRKQIQDFWLQKASQEGLTPEGEKLYTEKYMRLLQIPLDKQTPKEFMEIPTEVADATPPQPLPGIPAQEGVQLPGVGGLPGAVVGGHAAVPPPALPPASTPTRFPKADMQAMADLRALNQRRAELEMAQEQYRALTPAVAEREQATAEATAPAKIATAIATHPPPNLRSTNVTLAKDITFPDGTSYKAGDITWANYDSQTGTYTRGGMAVPVVRGGEESKDTTTHEDRDRAFRTFREKHGIPESTPLTGAQETQAIADYNKLVKPPTPEKGVTLVVPGPEGARVVKALPGQTLPSGAVTPQGLTSMTLPTTMTRNMVEKAPRVTYFVDRMLTLIAQNEKELGPLAGRWSELMAGRIGRKEIGYTKIRADAKLLQTALMNMHVGARGGTELLHHFASLMDQAIQDPENLKASLGEIRDYAEFVKTEGAVHPPGGPPPNGDTQQHTLGETRSDGARWGRARDGVEGWFKPNAQGKLVKVD